MDSHIKDKEQNKETECMGQYLKLFSTNAGCYVPMLTIVYCVSMVASECCYVTRLADAGYYGTWLTGEVCCWSPSCN